MAEKYAETVLRKLVRSNTTTFSVTPVNPEGHLRTNARFPLNPHERDYLERLRRSEALDELARLSKDLPLT